MNSLLLPVIIALIPLITIGVAAYLFSKEKISLSSLKWKEGPAIAKDRYEVPKFSIPRPNIDFVARCYQDSTYVYYKDGILRVEAENLQFFADESRFPLWSKPYEQMIARKPKEENEYYNIEILQDDEEKHLWVGLEGNQAREFLLAIATHGVGPVLRPKEKTKNMILESEELDASLAAIAAGTSPARKLPPGLEFGPASAHHKNEPTAATEHKEGLASEENIDETLAIPAMPVLTPPERTSTDSFVPEFKEVSVNKVDREEENLPQASKPNVMPQLPKAPPPLKPKALKDFVEKVLPLEEEKSALAFPETTDFVELESVNEQEDEATVLYQLAALAQENEFAQELENEMLESLGEVSIEEVTEENSAFFIDKKNPELIDELPSLTLPQKLALPVFKTSVEQETPEEVITPLEPPMVLESPVLQEEAAAELTLAEKLASASHETTAGEIPATYDSELMANERVLTIEDYNIDLEYFNAGRNRANDHMADQHGVVYTSEDSGLLTKPEPGENPGSEKKTRRQLKEEKNEAKRLEAERKAKYKAVAGKRKATKK